MSGIARCRRNASAGPVASVLAAQLVLIHALSVAAQPPGQPFWEGTHAFRNLLDRHRLQPLKRLNDLQGESEKTLLIVLGDTEVLDQIHSGVLGGHWITGLNKFLQQGGAVLVASDHAGPEQLRQALGVRASREKVRISTEEGYRGLADCPFVRVLPNGKPPVFEGLHRIATNKPSYFHGSDSFLVPLAGFPEGCTTENVPWLGLAGPIFAVGGTLNSDKTQARVLVLADHSIFINSMMLQPDNDNFVFADRCIRWLAGPGNRDRALLIEDGFVVPTFDVPVEEIAAPPLPTIDEFVPKANALLAKLEEKDELNRLFAGVPTAAVMRVLLILLTLGVLMIGFVKLRRSRVRLDSKATVLAQNADSGGPTATLIEQRNQAMLRRDNLWEAARSLAQQFFGPTPDEAEKSKSPRVITNAGWWRRWALRRRVSRLWRLAHGDRPSPVSAGKFARLLRQIDGLKTAQARGVLRLDMPNPSKDRNQA